MYRFSTLIDFDTETVYYNYEQKYCYRKLNVTVLQVAEWMGRREAWSAERSADSRTKPTRWEFSKRGYSHQKLGIDNPAVQMDNEENGTTGKVKIDDGKEKINIM
jgi:hypothetical protein